MKSDLKPIIDSVLCLIKFADGEDWRKLFCNCREKPLRRFLYLSYLQSHAWNVMRVRRMVIDNFQCQVCGQKFDLQVHHRTYDNLGSEKIEDLQTLCGTHHSELHLNEKERAISILLREQPEDWQIQLERLIVGLNVLPNI